MKYRYIIDIEKEIEDKNKSHIITGNSRHFVFPQWEIVDTHRFNTERDMVQFAHDPSFFFMDFQILSIYPQIYSCGGKNKMAWPSYLLSISMLCDP